MHHSCDSFRRNSLFILINYNLFYFLFFGVFHRWIVFVKNKTYINLHYMFVEKHKGDVRETIARNESILNYFYLFVCWTKYFCVFVSWKEKRNWSIDWVIIFLLVFFIHLERYVQQIYNSKWYRIYSI